MVALEQIYRHNAGMKENVKPNDMKGKHLYLDCFSGIAGDMFLGAMIDLGVPEEVIRENLAKLPLHNYQLRIGRVQQMSIEGCDVKVIVNQEQHHFSSHSASAAHGHQTWKYIQSMIDGSSLDVGIKQRALDIFLRVARAESHLHGMTLEDISFHEVGAVDSIIDVVGAAIALDYLTPIRVTSRPVPLGHGTIQCAHGALPIPSPAALEILTGMPVEDGGIAEELCTPTGAAIVAHCAQAFGHIPAAILIGVGYGAGDNPLPDRPNHLRVMLFEPTSSDIAEQEAVIIEANIDDMPPEWCGHIMEKLFEAGARDVWYTPIVMKKGRPALTISVLSPAKDVEALGTVLLTESTTIGLRYYAVGRRTLYHRRIQVDTIYGTQTIKLAMEGDRIANVAPEFEICKATANELNIPLKEVFTAAIEAYRKSR